MRFAVSLLFLCSFTFAQSPKDILAGLPLRFEHDAKSRWVTRGPGYTVGFQENSATLIAGGRALRLTFEGASGQGFLDWSQCINSSRELFHSRRLPAKQGIHTAGTNRPLPWSWSFLLRQSRVARVRFQSLATSRPVSDSDAV